MTTALIVAIVAFAAFVQSLSGFGFAVIIMPLITLTLGLQTAAPLVAFISLTVYSINVVRFRQGLNLKEVARLGAASLLGVPIGIWALTNLDESVIKQIVGLVLICYAVYALLQPATRFVISGYWVYPTGFVAGCLGGAYNTPGPPAIIYGSLRQWPKDEFRAAMQALFFVNGVLVVASHTLAKHVTAEVLTFYLYAVPALLLGILAASRADSRVDRNLFRKLTTVMILFLGLSLTLGFGAA
jgi:uncharacterized membrane protein YfcA